MKAYLACNDYGNTAIDVIDGSTITEEYSETLDSASIRLAPLNAPLNIAPYQEVKLVEGNQSWCFLVDDFTENQINNRDGGKVYSYSINLMSQTKYLEKIQLPNVCVTHGETKKTLWEVIQRFYKYCPKIKMRYNDSWGYSRFLTLDPDMQEKFDVPCADLQLSAPTLRQALTAVMTQVGCIPAVRNRVITYLDLKAPQTSSGLDASEAIISRSQSSGSYVNSLVNASGGLLDSTGKSVSERLCFRDRNNLLLKQLQNLVLETRFPIYKVTKLIANGYFTGTGIYLFTDSNHSNQWSVVESAKFYISEDNGVIGLTVKKKSNEYQGDEIPLRVQGKAYLLGEKITAGGYQWFIDGQTSINRAIQWVGFKDTIPLPNSWLNRKSDRFVVFVGECEFDTGNTYNIIATNSNAVQGQPQTDPAQIISDIQVFRYNATFGTKGEQGWHFISGGAYITTNPQPDLDLKNPKSLDMTKLCKEASARSGLKVDFLELTDPTRTPPPITVDKASEYVYTTVSYNIGDKFIRGFSDTYTVSNGWWNVTKPMIENLALKVGGWTSVYDDMTIDQAKAVFAGIFDDFLEGQTVGHYDYSYNLTTSTPVATVNFQNRFAPINPYIDGSDASYATMFFDIEYQPISSPVLKFTRKGADFPIEQYDSKQNGLSSVEKVSISEYETIDRLGSDVLSIHQRNQDLIPLNSYYGEYTIFKRVISYRKNYLEADYFASKNYVLKNYFTAIQTKYRAYQYVDYSQSVERNECIHAFLEIRDGKGIGSSSDRFAMKYLGSIEDTRNREYDYIFLDGMFHGRGGSQYGRPNITNEEAGQLGLIKSFRKYQDNNYWLDESALTHSDRFIAFSALDFDNASKGIYVDGTYLKGENLSSEKLGGIPQRYYEAQGNLNELGFTSKIHYFDMQATLDDVQALPKHPTNRGLGLIQLYASPVDTQLAYKDNAERLGETIDLEVINHIPEFSFNENLLTHSASASVSREAVRIRIVADLGGLKGADEKRGISNNQYEDMNGNLVSLSNGSKTLEDSIDLILGHGDNGSIWFNFGQFSNQIRSTLGRVPTTATIVFEYGLGTSDHYMKDVCRFTAKAGGGITSIVAKINDTQGRNVYQENNGILVISGTADLVDADNPSGDWGKSATFDI